MVEKSKKEITDTTKRVGPYVHNPKTVQGTATPELGPNGYPTHPAVARGPHGNPQFVAYDPTHSPRNKK